MTRSFGRLSRLLMLAIAILPAIHRAFGDDGGTSVPVERAIGVIRAVDDHFHNLEWTSTLVKGKLGERNGEWTLEHQSAARAKLKFRIDRQSNRYWMQMIEGLHPKLSPTGVEDATVLTKVSGAQAFDGRLVRVWQRQGKMSAGESAPALQYGEGAITEDASKIVGMDFHSTNAITAGSTGCHPPSMACPLYDRFLPCPRSSRRTSDYSFPRRFCKRTMAIGTL